MYPDWLKKLDDFKTSNEITTISCRKGHCGILYKKNNEYFHFEQLGHFKTHLTNKVFGKEGIESNNYTYLWSKLTLKEERQRQIPRICWQVNQYNKQGFPFGGAIVNDLEYLPIGRFISEQNDTVSFTCSTFVLSIFKAAQIQLINEESWEQRESDIKFQRKILRRLKKMMMNVIPNFPKVKLKHVINQKNSLGRSRIEPEEVSVSGTNPVLPSNYDYCKENSKHLHNAFNQVKLPSTIASSANRNS